MVWRDHFRILSQTSIAYSCSWHNKPTLQRLVLNALIASDYFLHASRTYPLIYRLLNAMTVRAPVSDAARRVQTETKMLHGVVRLPGLESIPDAWCRGLYAERSLTIRAQHEEACACMDKDTHTETWFMGQCRRGAGLREDFA